MSQRSDCSLPLMRWRSVSWSPLSKYMMCAPSSPRQTWRTFRKNHSLAMMDIDVVKACKSTLHQFYRFALLPHVRRWTFHIRSAMTDGAGELSRGEASTVVFGGCDRGAPCSVRQCNGGQEKGGASRPIQRAGMPMAEIQTGQIL